MQLFDNFNEMNNCQNHDNLNDPYMFGKSIASIEINESFDEDSKINILKNTFGEKENSLFPFFTTGLDTIFFHDCINNDNQFNNDLNKEKNPQDKSNQNFDNINNNHNNNDHNNNNHNNNVNLVNAKDNENIKFITTAKKVLGRKRKEDKSKPSKHTKKSNDNGSKRFIIQCMESIDQSINSKIEPYNYKLYKPSLTNNLPQKVNEKKIFLEKKIVEYYENYAQPRHCLEENKNIYKIHNHNVIKELKSLNDIKINGMLNSSFIDNFKCFLNDIKINEDFKTLKDYFNDVDDEDNYYSKEEKNKIKNYCEKLISNGITPRNRNK